MEKKFIAIVLAMCISIPGTAFSVSADAQESEATTDLKLPEDKLIRDKEGKIVGVDVTERVPDVKYSNYNIQQLMDMEQFKEYEQLGLTYDKDNNTLLFAEMEVVNLEDEYKNGIALQYLSEQAASPKSGLKRISVTAIRDDEFHLQYFEFSELADSTLSDDSLVEYESALTGYDTEAEP
ncbi:MAG: hypothetical protein Q4C91_13620 [Eubacteriales bacterium]|nr:hypothetical protein [Eubacteriales bacterium]